MSFNQAGWKYCLNILPPVSMATPGMNTRKPAGMDDFLGTRTPDQNSQSSVGSTSLSLSMFYNMGRGQVLTSFLGPVKHSILSVPKFHPDNSSYYLILQYVISSHFSTKQSVSKGWPRWTSSPWPPWDALSIKLLVNSVTKWHGVGPILIDCRECRHSLDLFLGIG